MQHKRLHARALHTVLLSYKSTSITILFLVLIGIALYSQLWDLANGLHICSFYKYLDKGRTVSYPKSPIDNTLYSNIKIQLDADGILIK